MVEMIHIASNSKMPALSMTKIQYQYSATQSQNVVAAYFSSNQLLHFVFCVSLTQNEIWRETHLWECFMTIFSLKILSLQHVYGYYIGKYVV